MLAPPLNSTGPSLLGTVSHLNSALFHGICSALFSSSLKPLFSPGLGEPLSSYLEVVLYKFHRSIDRFNALSVIFSEIINAEVMV